MHNKINQTEKLAPYIEDIFKNLLDGISEEDLSIYLDVLDKIDINITNLNIKCG